MKTKEKIIFLLIVVFFAHGFIYLFFPDKLYESFWGKYIKYVVFVFYFLLTLSYLNWAKFFYVSGIIFSFISLAFFFTCGNISYGYCWSIKFLFAFFSTGK